MKRYQSLLSKPGQWPSLFCVRKSRAFMRSPTLLSEKMDSQLYLTAVDATWWPEFLTRVRAPTKRRTTGRLACSPHRSAFCPVLSLLRSSVALRVHIAILPYSLNVLSRTFSLQDYNGNQALSFGPIRVMRLELGTFRESTYRTRILPQLAVRGM
jgi:hypothetical protein